MNRFEYARATSFKEARDMLGRGDHRLPVLKAGGMDLVDHMKEGLLEPDLVVDISRLGPKAPELQVGEGGPSRVAFHANATLDDLAHSKVVLEHTPVLAQASASAATPQIRNVASAAGNLLQRPRCWYYRHREFDCLKKGGSRCFAAEGENAYHAIFGAGPCHIVHPSNIAPALIVCNGVVHVEGGDRDTIPVRDLFHMPDRGIRDEHNLKQGEVITRITAEQRPMSAFAVIKHKQSFDWPLVFACVALDVRDRKIVDASVCAGAVAPVPWPLDHVAKALVGLRTDDEQGVKRACDRSTEGAEPMTDNAYKMDLLPVAVRRAVRKAAGLPVEEL